MKIRLITIWVLLNASILSSYAKSTEAKQACGLKGNIQARLEDCSKVQTESKNLKIISQDGLGHQLILDQKNNLVWSQYFQVKDLSKYYDDISLNTIQSICNRFEPFGIKANASGWKLPLKEQLDQSVKNGNSIGSSFVLSSSVKSLSRLHYNGYSYDEQFKLVPTSYDEISKKLYAIDGSIQGAKFRCVVDKSLLYTNSEEDKANFSDLAKAQNCQVNSVGFSISDTRISNLLKSKNYIINKTNARFIIEATNLNLSGQHVFSIYEHAKKKKLYENYNYLRKKSSERIFLKDLPSCKRLMKMAKELGN